MENPGRARWCPWIMLLSMLLPGAALAQGSGSGVTLNVMVEQERVVTNEKGEKEKRRVAATRVVPGDEVIYTIHYRNGSDEPAENVSITIPIARETTYVANSARGAGTLITYSVDGGAHFADPGRLLVGSRDGHRRPATAADYTHIRWKFIEPLPPGAAGAVSYRARLN